GKILLLSKKAAGFDIHVPDLLIVCVGAANVIAGAARSVSHRALLVDLGKNRNKIAAKGLERYHQPALETRSISQQQDHGRDTPGHAQHSEHAPAFVV